MATTGTASKRTTSLSGSSRLSLSVGKAAQTPTTAGRHPLKQDWSISYVHRPPGAKVEYEKEIKRVATFGSIESFLHLYSHLTPPNELPPVTDILVFLSRIGRPGVWEEMRDGGKFTLRLLHPVTPLLYESLLLALVGDQFDDSDSVVGCVLSARSGEGILSVWVEEEGEAVRSGALKEKILNLLSLPASTSCEYRSNRALLDMASKPFPVVAPSESDSKTEGHQSQRQYHSNHHNQHHQHSHTHTNQHHSHTNSQSHSHSHHNTHHSQGFRGYRRENGERNRDGEGEKDKMGGQEGGARAPPREGRTNGWGI